MFRLSFSEIVCTVVYNYMHNDDFQATLSSSYATMKAVGGACQWGSLIEKRTFSEAVHRQGCVARQTCSGGIRAALAFVGFAPTDDTRLGRMMGIYCSDDRGVETSCGVERSEDCDGESLRAQDAHFQNQEKKGRSYPPKGAGGCR